MHEQHIINSILSKLNLDDVQVQVFSLVCSPKQLKIRLGKDIQVGKRSAEIIERSQERLACYHDIASIIIDVSEIKACQAASEILKHL